MAKYRHQLPQLSGDVFLTDGGIETTLIFHEGFELPYFAAFDLLNSRQGSETLRQYFRTYAAIAREQNLGFVLESVTWRASPDWAAKLGYSDQDLINANLKAIELLEDIRTEFETPTSQMVISGCIGPRGDGYNPTEMMTADAAQRYHSTQTDAFAVSDADMITAITMTYADEAIGLTRAAKAADMPVVISFTVETDGRLPSGQTLREAIDQVDSVTGEAPEYYMINCAHPTHFEDALAAGERWAQRIQGIRANASTKSHAELDEATALDDGNPAELGMQYRKLRDTFRHFNVLGGCCGTDHRHIEAISRACTA
jgi:S-methylmethionine-dependent homocysteine/selenocysteine methylase